MAFCVDTSRNKTRVSEDNWVREDNWVTIDHSANPEKKKLEIAPKIIQDLGVCLQNWHLDSFRKNEKSEHSEKKIFLYLNGKELNVKTFDCLTSKSFFSRIPVPNDRTIEETIAHLKKCEIVNLDDNVPSFLEPFIKYKIDSKRLSLISFNGDLVWQMYDKESSTKKRLRISVLEGTSINPKMISYTRALFNKHIKGTEGVSKAERISYLRDMEIKKIEELGLDWRVHIQPKSEKSLIENRLSVSKSCWAVTFIVTPDGPGSCKCHAAAIFEGLNEEGKYFMHLTHFTGDEISSKEMSNPQSLRYTKRSMVWMRSSNKVLEMLEAIKSEKKEDPYPKFALSGFFSIFSKGEHNCLTWISQYLKWFLGIDLLAKNKFKTLIAVPKNVHKPEYYKKREVTQHRI